MKTIKVLLMAFPMALTLFSCAQDEGMVVDESLKHKVNLNIGFTVASDVETRATRLLETIDPWQRVTDMRVYLFRSKTGEEGTFKLYHPSVVDEATGQSETKEYFYVSNFEKDLNDENEGIWKEDDNEYYAYSCTSLLHEGYYRLLAVGFDDANESPVKLNWTPGQTTWETACLSTDGTSPIASEIFTGYATDGARNLATIQVNPKTTEVSTEIKCWRDVAGVFLYVENIPTKLKAQFNWTPEEAGTGIIDTEITKDKEYDIYELALVTVGYNSKFNAVTRKWEGDFINEFDNSRFNLIKLASIEIPIDHNGEDDDKSNGKDEDKKDNYFREKLAVGQFVMPSETYRAKENSLLKTSEDGITDPKYFDRSMYLCFFTKTKEGFYYPVQLWPIKLVRTNPEYDYPGDLMLGSNDPYHYNLIANHLYCLGMKSETLDQPVDLEKEKKEHPKDDLTITVIGSWQYEINIQM